MNALNTLGVNLFIDQFQCIYLFFCPENCYENKIYEVFIEQFKVNF